MAQKGGFLDFDKNLIHSYVHFLHEYESNIGILTFCKKHLSWKNLVLELWSKNLQANQNAGFFKLQYITNKLSCEVEFS